MPALPPTHREAIREIFLRPRIEYTAHEAARLLRLSVADLLKMIEEGTVHAELRRKRKQLGGPRQMFMVWNELASVAMLRWTIMQIHDALGSKANQVLPSLYRPIELKKVRLPEYQIRLLETLAQESGVSLEEYIFGVLRAIEVEADPETMEKFLPGFKEAIEFPNV